jgi:glycosyltransferase involved in cell wall biosynthesis
MNGGMDYPPAFRRHRGAAERALLTLGRWSAGVLNRLMPGKRRAALLLVANERTRQALPRGVCPRVIEFVENGVDLSLWRPAPVAAVTPPGATTFVYMGRLVDWKAVDLLVEAFVRAAARTPMRLVVIGDGVERQSLEALAAQSGVLATSDGEIGKIAFVGWLPQQECARRLQDAEVLVLPSLLECGGAVVLEAMSMGKPVIATAWGGPLDYLDPSCGILVPPGDRPSLVAGLAEAMDFLARRPDQRLALGAAGAEKVRAEYDWRVKIDRMLSIYRAVAQERSSRAAA